MYNKLLGQLINLSTQKSLFWPICIDQFFCKKFTIYILFNKIKPNTYTDDKIITINKNEKKLSLLVIFAKYLT